ncbi:hypothetical protein A3863_04530 (plasmid) [Priestia endophytica]|uniref:DUF3967 domain-containing protein n=1 Tax=Priestia endophytica TaxID=135735 RepID=UPI000DCA7658|nr:DUF3967 domain-containing protein [Priestia endophytica]RAS91850.1 hypothetical protein A3863_04530 [Priestia endophytica]
MTLVYKTNEVMNKLNLKDSVFKKYIALLEKEGYVIQRNGQGHRLYSEEDVETLEMFMELIKYDGMTLESVAKKIGNSRGHKITVEDKEESYDVMTLVSSLLEEQKKQFEERTQKLLEQQEIRFLKKIEEIEEKSTENRDKLLIESIRETKELKNLVLESQKKKWWEFWK